MYKQEKKQNSIVIENNITIIVPDQVKAISQCKRGFWWGTALHSAEVNQTTIDKWASSFVLLHVGEVSVKPLRTKVFDNGKGNIYEPKRVKVRNSEHAIRVSTRVNSKIGK